MSKLSIGDRVICYPVIREVGFGRSYAAEGTVVWLHPEGRYHTVEFNEGQYAYRESFSGIER